MLYSAISKIVQFQQLRLDFHPEVGGGGGGVGKGRGWGAYKSDGDGEMVSLLGVWARNSLSLPIKVSLKAVHKMP